MSETLYEHPLSQQVRNYLKLEQLFEQAQASLKLDMDIGYSVYFNALFSIIDNLERNDIRGDMIKDLEKLEVNLIQWSKAPNIDRSMVNTNLHHVSELIKSLKLNPVAWQQLQHDKLLTCFKKRFAIQGGSCLFDLPQLNNWLSQSANNIIQQATQWLTMLSPVSEATTILLLFLRQKGEFLNLNADNGFYQESGDGVSLLRIAIDENSNIYPTVSGNKFRYSVRFMTPCKTNGHQSVSQKVSFKLARC